MARFVTVIFLALIAAAPALACGPYGSFMPSVTAQDSDKGSVSYTHLRAHET